MASPPIERRRVFFSGRVQGVGFRYTTREVATRFDVSGTVRNLPDGRVELVAEGALPELEGLLEAIRERFEGSIRDETCETLNPTGDLTGFEILR